MYEGFKDSQTLHKEKQTASRTLNESTSEFKPDFSGYDQQMSRISGEDMKPALDYSFEAKKLWETLGMIVQNVEHQNSQ